MPILIVIGIVFIVVSLLTMRFLTKNFSIDQKVNTMSKKHKRIQWIGVLLFVFAFVGTAYQLMDSNPNMNILIITLPFYFSISMFRVFMEWRYNRQANRWILEICSTFFILALYVLLVFLTPILIG